MMTPWLLRSWWAMAACMVVVASAPQPGSPPALRITTLTSHVSVLSGGPDGNILVWHGEDEALIVDGQALDKLEAVRAGIAQVTSVPVTTVINTHYHPDHVGANGSYAAEGARIISHAVCREQMTQASAVAALGWNIEADVIHAGDVFEVAEYPFLDIPHGGSLPGLVAGVDRLLELAGEETVIVPGHGPLMGRADLAAYRDMLGTLLERVQAAIDAEQHAQDFLAGAPVDDFDERWGSPAGAARLATYAFVGMAPPELVRSRTENDAGR